EQPTATQPAGAVDVNQQADDEEVPHHLVEEGGLDGGDDIPGGPPRDGCQVAGFIDAAVDLQGQRAICGATVKLLVEPVAQPPDGLCQQDGGRDGVGKRHEREAFELEQQRHGDPTQDHRAPDAEATVGDLQRVDGVLPRPEVLIVVGDDVVDAPADDARGHGDEQRIDH